MGIHVLSHAEAEDFLANSTGEYDVLFVAAEPVPAVEETLQARSREMLRLYFHDAVDPWPDVKLPTSDHVSRALDWANGRADGRAELIVTCAAGISRSSALAYLLWCRAMPPAEAVRQLNQDRHMPNELVVRLGAEALGNPAIFSTFAEWREATRQLWLARAMLASSNEEHD
jgi:predicted protein tyrosine phosphatase